MKTQNRADAEIHVVQEAVCWVRAISPSTWKGYLLLLDLTLDEAADELLSEEVS